MVKSATILKSTDFLPNANNSTASKNTTNILFETTTHLLNSTQPRESTMESSTSTDQITVELNNREGEIN